MNYTHRKKRVCEARNQYGNGKMTEGDVKPLVQTPKGRHEHSFRRFFSGYEVECYLYFVVCGQTVNCKLRKCALLLAFRLLLVKKKAIGCPHSRIGGSIGKRQCLSGEFCCGEVRPAFSRLAFVATIQLI